MDERSELVSICGAEPLSLETALAPCPQFSAATKCETCRLRALSFCGAIDPGELDVLDALSTPMAFKGRSMLFEQGADADAVYNITAGVAMLSKVLPDLRRQVIGFALPGDFLGLALNQKNVFSVEAVTPLEACRFQREAFSDFLDARPPTMRRLYSKASYELTLAQDQIVVLGRNSAEERLASFLIGFRNRWMRVNGNRLYVALPMRRQDMADFLGLRLETVSRVMSRLVRQKLIAIVPDGVRLLDVARLEELAAH